MSASETLHTNPTFRTVQAYDAVRQQMVTVTLGPAAPDTNDIDAAIATPQPASQIPQPTLDLPNNTHSRTPERTIRVPRVISYLGKNALLAVSLVISGAYVGSTAVHQLEGDTFQDPVEFSQTLRKGYVATDTFIDMLTGNDSDVTPKGDQ